MGLLPTAHCTLCCASIESIWTVSTSKAANIALMSVFMSRIGRMPLTITGTYTRYVSIPPETKKGSFIRPTPGKLVGCRAFETVCQRWRCPREKAPLYPCSCQEGLSRAGYIEIAEVRPEIAAVTDTLPTQSSVPSYC